MSPGFVRSRAHGWVPGRPVLFVLTVVVALGIVPVLAVAPRPHAVGAQETTTTPATGEPVARYAFPGALVARIDDSDLPPELRLGEISVAAVAPDAVTFRVGFVQPFTTPKRDYRVSVLVGDPTGSYLRASFEPGKEVGAVQRREGDKWVDSSPTAASVAGDGVFEIAVPSMAVTPGSALWAEVQSGAGNKAKVKTSSYFSYDSIVGKNADGSLSSSAWGSIRSPEGDSVSGAVQIPGGDTTGIVLKVASQGMSVNYLSPVIDKMLDVPVTREVDRVWIVSGASGPVTSGGYVEMDRAAGTVKFFDASQEPAVDLSDTGGWLARGFDPGGPGASTTLTFNLAAIMRALRMTSDAASVALGLDRSFVLGDGRRVETKGVLGTLEWFELAPRPEPAPGAPDGPPKREPESVLSSEDASSGTGNIAVVVGVVAVGLVVIAGLTFVMTGRTRRRQRKFDDEFGWGGAEVGDIERIAEDLAPVGSVGDLTQIGSDAPEPEDTDPEEPEPEEPEPEEPEPEDTEPEDTEPEDTEPEDDAQEAPGSSKGHSPDDVLSALLADVSEASARLDRLADDS